mgnify:CR=1 FL=1
MKFDELWEKSEKIISEYSKLDCVEFTPLDDLNDLLDKLTLISDDQESERSECMGKILINLCFFSKLYNINVFEALAKAAQDLNLERLEKMDGG